MKRIMTLFVPLVVIFGAAATTVTTAAAKDSTCSTMSVSPKWPADKWPTENPKWPSDTDSLRCQVLLVPEKNQGSSVCAELIVLFPARAKWPTKAYIRVGDKEYPLPLPQGKLEEDGHVEMDGIIYRYRRLRPYER